MNLCIFSGTFNPIHNAHLKMAEFVVENLNIDKVIFIPAYIPPHKNIDKTIANHRYNMVKLAIKDNPNFEISDVEYKSEGKSYSLITVKKIIEEYKIKGKLNFLIGTDAFAKIRSWYKVDELKQLVHFIVYPRETDIINPNDFKDFDFEILKANTMNISSTDLRNGRVNGLTNNIKEYITKYELYDRIH